MTDITSDCTFKQRINGDYKELLIITSSTANTDDTIAFDLSDYGMKSFYYIHGVVHTTANSVIVEEAPTTAVSSGELTITLGGTSQDNKIRVYRVIGL